MSYDSIDEVRYGRFSQCGRFIYTLTKIGTLNIFDKLTAKLISKLNPQRNPDAAIDDQSLDVEVDGILGVSDPQLGEQLVAYRQNRVIKYSE